MFIFSIKFPQNFEVDYFFKPPLKKLINNNLLYLDFILTRAIKFFSKVFCMKKKILYEVFCMKYLLHLSHLVHLVDFLKLLSKIKFY